MNWVISERKNKIIRNVTPELILNLDDVQTLQSVQSSGRHLDGGDWLWKWLWIRITIYPPLWMKAFTRTVEVYHLGREKYFNSSRSIVFYSLFRLCIRSSIWLMWCYLSSRASRPSESSYIDCRWSSGYFSSPPDLRNFAFIIIADYNRFTITIESMSSVTALCLHSWLFSLYKSITYLESILHTFRVYGLLTLRLFIRDIWEIADQNVGLREACPC